MRDNFGWFALVVVYFGLVLAAMQVGLATTLLASHRSFQRACYGFTVFSIVTLLAAVVVVAGIVGATAVGHVLSARSFAHSVEQKRRAATV